MKDRKKKKEGGFTLIEILIVVGIMAVLASVVLVAVNPARQFKLARDAQRMSNVNSILNAVGQNLAEHHGLFVCADDAAPQPLPPTPTEIGMSGFNLARCIVPAYISALPFDPSAPGAYYASSSDYSTKYYISVDEQGHVTASSTGEITPSISVTR